MGPVQERIYGANQDLGLQPIQHVSSNVSQQGKIKPTSASTPPCGFAKGWWDAMKVKIEAFFTGKRFDSEKMGALVAERVRGGHLDATALRHFGPATLTHAFKNLQRNPGGSGGALPIQVHVLASHVIFNARDKDIKEAVAVVDTITQTQINDLLNDSNINDVINQYNPAVCDIILNNLTPDDVKALKALGEKREPKASEYAALFDNALKRVGLVLTKEGRLVEL